MIIIVVVFTSLEALRTLYALLLHCAVIGSVDKQVQIGKFKIKYTELILHFVRDSIQCERMYQHWNEFQWQGVVVSFELYFVSFFS